MAAQLPVIPASVLLSLPAIPALPPPSIRHHTSDVVPMEVSSGGGGGGGGGGGDGGVDGESYKQKAVAYQRAFIEGIEMEDQILWMESMAYESGRALRLGNRLQRLYNFQLFLIKKQIIDLDLSDIWAAKKRKEQLSLEVKAIEGKFNRDAEVQKAHKLNELKIFQSLPQEGSLSEIAETTVAMEWKHQQWIEGRIHEVEADLAQYDPNHKPTPILRLTTQRLKAKVRKAEEEEVKAKASADALQLELDKMKRLRKTAADAIHRRNEHERRKAQAQREIDAMICD